MTKAPDDNKLDQILSKVENKKEEEKEAIKKKLAQLKAKDLGKIIEQKEDKRLQPTAPTAVPNIYDNSTLFNREAVEQRMEKYSSLMEQQPKPEDEEPPKSWIQIKAAAIAERKANGGGSKPASLKSKKKKAPQPTIMKLPEEEAKGELSPLKRGTSDEANLLDKTEAPSDPEAEHKPLDPKSKIEEQKEDPLVTKKTGLKKTKTMKKKGK